LAAAGPDLLAIETIPDLDEVLALIEVLADFPDLAAWVSLTTLDGISTCAGQPLTEVSAALAGAPSVVAVGVNCSAPTVVTPALRAMSSAGSRLLAYPNAGQTWHSETETWSGPASPVLPSELVSEWLDLGAKAIGGCCGVDSAGVTALAADVGGWHSD
jgi:homocysteine S-methyltransferase